MYIKLEFERTIIGLVLTGLLLTKHFSRQSMHVSLSRQRLKIFKKVTLRKDDLHCISHEITASGLSICVILK